LLAELHGARDLGQREGAPSKGEFGRLLGIWTSRSEDDDSWTGSPEPYRYLGQRLLKLGAAPLAKEVCQTAMALSGPSGQQHGASWASDVTLRLIAALAFARTANPEEAQRLLWQLHDELDMDTDRPLDDSERHVWEETLGVLARTYKDQAFRSQETAERRELWRTSFRLYERAFHLTHGYWTGINVATLACLNGARERAREVASQVYDQCQTILERSSANDDDRYWLLATLAEAALVREDLSDAEQYYRQAYESAPRAFGNLISTRSHARRLLEHYGHNESLLDQWMPIPKVVIFVGHMIDRPDRPQVRLPPERAGAVKTTIRLWLKQHNGLVGFSSGACGSDILFQEALRELGGECNLVLPYNESEFLKDSVEIRGDGEWGQRFQKVVDNATRVVRASSTRLYFGSVSYEFANSFTHGLAMRRAEQLETSVLRLAVWDGLPGDGPSGTASVVRRWHECRIPVHRVDLSDPTAQPPSPIKVVADERAAREVAAQPLGEREYVVVGLLFADAVGFSSLSDPEVRLFVREFLGRVAELASSYPEILVRETWGDGLFFALSTLDATGRFALQLIDLLHETHWESLGLSHPISLRVALHAGPVYLSVDPITGLRKAAGTHVSRAARLEPQTPPGEIYASEAFAALTAVEKCEDFACEYVKQLRWAKQYGTFPTYVVRPRKSVG
jgi:class 3 adenylate cyclase/tetratricopeptide (TPR) repeat protein